jgi:hypothetical protein
MPYFNPVKFPTVAKFVKLQQRDRNLVAEVCKERGLDTAMEILSRLTPKAEQAEDAK